MDHSGGRLLPAIARFSVRRAWWVVAFWLVATVAVTLLVPRLEDVIARDDTPVIPDDTAAVQALAVMDAGFSTGDSRSFVVVVLERPGGLSRADLRYYRSLGPRLEQDPSVTWVQDVRTQPELRDAFVSDDGEAAYLNVGLPGPTGAPASLAEVAAVRDIVDEGRPEGLTTAVSGTAGTIADLANETEHSVVRITVVTVVVIGLLLLLLYRSLSLMVLVLGMVGIALGTARGAIAFSGEHDLLPVSTFTGSFMTAVVLGAATDYAIFLVSRYHELRREGVAAREAAVIAGSRVSGVVVGSALTVVLANAAMALAHVGIFTTTGPAVAVATALTLAIAITLVPAVLALAGSRGFLEPRAERSTERWRRTAATVVRRPGRVFAAGLVPLLVLAAFAPFLTRGFDTRDTQPDDTESNVGYDLLAAHYPVNETLPDYVVITSDHDMRNPRDLAALEQAAVAMGKVPGVIEVRGVTRPTGNAITQASVGYQAGVVGQRLGRARDRIVAGQGDATRLSDGSTRLDAGAGQLADGADRAVDGARRLLDGLTSLERGVTRLADGSDRAVDGSRRLRDAARLLAAGLSTAADQTQVAVDGLGMAADALDSSVTCGIDPVCSGARDGVRQVYVGQRDQLLPGLRRAAGAAARLADGGSDLSAGLDDLSAGLDQARRGVDRLAQGQRTFRDRLGELSGGADQVADGTGRLADGTEQVVDSVDELGSGLGRAARFLQQTGRATRDPAIGGFYLPPSAFDSERFALARGLFLSPDGRTARISALGATDALGPAAAARATELRDTAERSLRGTSLGGSDVTVAGMAAINADLAALSAHDFTLLAVVALIAVFVILLLLLRSLVAATALLISVIVSYAAAIGLGVLVWQVLLGVPLDWAVPAIAFTLLVAVGSDYNLLLMKRMQEEAPAGERDGIARATAATGSVITAAGLIFAASMFALMAGTVTTLTQVGFTIGCGLLLDTFVVRTLVIPALAALLGPRLWWPTRRRTAPAGAA